MLIANYVMNYREDIIDQTVQVRHSEQMITVCKMCIVLKQ